MKYLIKDKTPMTTPSKVTAVFQSLLKAEDKIDQDKEHFWVMHLDARHVIKCVELVSLGALDRAIIMGREVFSRAVRERSHSIILCHNHPSGTPEPSEEDLSATRKIIAGGKLLDIQVLDHIVITLDKSQSIREWGLIDFNQVLGL